MADRLTQLQEAVNIMADHFCNAVGYLQQAAPPSQFPGFEHSPVPKKEDVTNSEENALHFAQIISRTAKDIDLLVDSLPNEDSSPELQAACLRRLEQENEEAANRLQKAVQESEILLSQVQSALHEIAQVQLQCQALESDFS